MALPAHRQALEPAATLGGRRGRRKIKQVHWYYVKWTNLSHKFCSWEKGGDIASDDFAVARFRRWQTLPPMSKTDLTRSDDLKRK